MSANNPHGHEEPRARIILDKLAKHAGLDSGQALMNAMEAALKDPAKAKEIGELVGAWLPKPEPEAKVEDAAAPASG